MVIKRGSNEPDVLCSSHNSTNWKRMGAAIYSRVIIMISLDDFIIYSYLTLVTVYYASYLLLYFHFLDSSYNIYFYDLNLFIQAFIAIFLLIRYHPFKNKHVLAKSDGHLIFASACFLLINIGILQIFNNWLGQKSPPKSDKEYPNIL